VKSDRLVAILLALQNDGKRSASDLAELLEVSPRTIYRDVDALSAAGVPVYAERGAQGGIVLADSYRDALARFDEAELQALFVSSDDVLADLGFLGRRRSALAKIARALPVRERAKVERTRGRVHIDTRRWWGASAPTATLAALREAVWADRRVVFSYTDRAGAATRRTVDPLGLVAKAGVWYLAARDRGVVKTFRAQRIGRVRILAQTFERPRDFDLATYWETVAEKMAEMPAPLTVTLEMSERALASAKSYLNVQSHTRLPGTAPRASLVRIEFPAFEAALHETIGWSEEAVVVEPPELRKRLAEHARALLARYGEA
jgi:predicted DNA-binding transcriptional regulator YafY